VFFFRTRTAPPPITLDSRLEPDSCVVSTTHGDETVLLNAATGRYFSLNSAGGEVWTAVCDHSRLADVVALLQSKYSPAADRIETDVLSLATRLLAESLVHTLP
jgi:hypothetical protein